MRGHYRKDRYSHTSRVGPESTGKSPEQLKWDALLDEEFGKVPEPEDLGARYDDLEPFLHEGLIKTRSGGRKSFSSTVSGGPSASVSQCQCAPPWVTITDPKTGMPGIEVCDVCRPQRVAEGWGQFHFVLSYLDRHGTLKKCPFPNGRYGYAFSRVFNDRASVRRDLRARILEAAILDFPLDALGERTELQRCRVAARIVNVSLGRVRYIYRGAMAEIKKLHSQRLTGHEPVGRWPWKFRNAKQRSYCILEERQRVQEQKLIRICELLSPLPPPSHRVLNSNLRRSLLEVRERLLADEEGNQLEFLRLALNEYERGLGDVLNGVGHLQPLMESLNDPNLRFAS